jgi:hypothetical protein
MFRLIRRIEKSVVGGYNFICNTWFFLGLGHSFGQAMGKARDTLPR